MNPQKTLTKHSGFRRVGIIEILVKLKSQGLADSTVRVVDVALRHLAENSDLADPESVKLFIASKRCALSYKNNLAKAYGYYAMYMGLSWKKPVYRFENKLPKIPTEAQLRLLIDSASRRYRVIFRLLLETGCMPVELSRVRRSDIDLQRGIIQVTGAKGHNSRNFKIKPDTLALLTYFLKVNPSMQPFPCSFYMSKCWREHKIRVSAKHGDKQLRTKRLYDLRHYYASMLYHKTKDILLVKERLGHKRIETTLIYTRLVDFPSEEWTVKAARSISEATALLESGFNYVPSIEGLQLYRT